MLLQKIFRCFEIQSKTLFCSLVVFLTCSYFTYLFTPSRFFRWLLLLAPPPPAPRNDPRCTDAYDSTREAAEAMAKRDTRTVLYLDIFPLVLSLCMSDCMLASWLCPQSCLRTEWLTSRNGNICSPLHLSARRAES